TLLPPPTGTGQLRTCVRQAACQLKCVPRKTSDGTLKILPVAGWFFGPGQRPRDRGLEVPEAAVDDLPVEGHPRSKSGSIACGQRLLDFVPQDNGQERKIDLLADDLVEHLLQALLGFRVGRQSGVG